MIDREKVIAGFEDSLANNGCGFMDGIGELFAVSGEDLQNAIALLKAQEPQILLVEDARALERVPIWLDVKSTNKYFYKGWALAYVIQNGIETTERLGITNTSGRMYWYKLDDYGKTWRCWNTKPSKEQMEAEPWND